MRICRIQEASRGYGACSKHSGSPTGDINARSLIKSSSDNSQQARDSSSLDEIVVTEEASNQSVDRKDAGFAIASMAANIDIAGFPGGGDAPFVTGSFGVNYEWISVSSVSASLRKGVHLPAFDVLRSGIANPIDVKSAEFGVRGRNVRASPGDSDISVNLEIAGSISGRQVNLQLRYVF